MLHKGEPEEEERYRMISEKQLSVTKWSQWHVCYGYGDRSITVVSFADEDVEGLLQAMECPALVTSQAGKGGGLVSDSEGLFGAPYRTFYHAEFPEKTPERLPVAIAL